MTPLYSFEDNEIKKALVDMLGSDYIEDIATKLTPTNLAKKRTIIYGDKEEEAGDVLIPDTEHELNKRDIEEIARML